MKLAAVILVFTTLTSLFAQAAPILTLGDQLTARYRPGTVLIQNNKRLLFLIQNDNQVLVYKVAVPKKGKTWLGETRVSEMHVRPAWMAPQAIVRDKPHLRGVTIPGGHPSNPMGERAILLEDNNVTQEIAIHGVTKQMDASIGTAASYGCIRMHNDDVIDLFERVRVGTPVVMVP